MVHRGGTVAGESPDKSEQRKSSGATTPGERDPRLAMSAARVDQPTAVFTLPPEPVSGEAADEADATEDAAGAEGAGRGADGNGRAGDGDRETRAGNADDTDKAGKAADTDDAGDSDDTGDSDANDADGADDAGRVDDGEAEAVEAGRRALAAASDHPTSEVTAVVPEPRLSAPEAPPRAPDAPPAPEGASEAPEAAESARSAAPAAVGGRGDADSADSAEIDAEDAADNDSEKGAEGGKSGPESGAIAGGDTNDADAEDDTDTDAEGDEPEAAAENDHDSKSGKDADDGGDGGNTDNKDADADADADAEAEEGNGKDDDSGAGAKGGAAPRTADKLDTPTGVFTPQAKRTGAVPAPAVDSPTTALKLPPAPRREPERSPSEKKGDDGGAGGKSADGGKKASTFVPLRSADPEPEAPAASAATAPKAPAAAPAKAPAEPPAAVPAAPAALVDAERTRQQPVPPLPPMDLLAELTNTPPTPMRTVARRFKIWTPVVVLLALIGAVAQILRPLPAPALELSAKPTFTFKGAKLALPFPTDGQGAVAVEGVGTIGTYGPQGVAPTASVAKAMTAYVVLRDRPLKEGEDGPKITIDAQAARESGNWENESVAKVSEGQQYTLKQLLQMTMIKSGNNTARLLARWNAGSEAAFVKKMNDAAKQLGMRDTVYTDPSGFKKTTVSTPADQLKLAEAVMNNKVLREITNTTNVDIPGSESIRNGNDRALLLEGVDGIKTGSSTPAGGNLLWSFVKEIDGTYYRINGVAMNARDGDSPYQKTQKAIDYSVKMIESTRDGMVGATVVKKGQAVGYLDNGLGGRVPVVATRDLKAIGWGGLEIELELSMRKGDLPRSGNAGDVIGELSVLSGPAKETVPVALRENLAEPGFGDKLTRLG
ncbi:serine hydrolase [Streptomyces sp. NPDC006798]|uniref:D-alanyl-D-alanine carboxypeptidase family protein n=1 Tax=Streptomyces sp. NPDC006798 TaxID=3155462 RepID=UPI0033F3B473